ncbi:hypothetical protein ScPMuIL_008942 [Solemya velum]
MTNSLTLTIDVADVANHLLVNRVVFAEIGFVNSKILINFLKRGRKVMKNVMVTVKYWLLVTLTVVLCSLSVRARRMYEDGTDAEIVWTSSSYLYVGTILSLLVVLTVTVYIVFLCGGCTEMEVGSTDHPACRTSNSNNYQTVVTDEILPTQQQYSTAGYGQSSGGLPYSLNISAAPSNFNEPISPAASYSHGFNYNSTHEAVPTAPNSQPLPQSVVTGYNAQRPGPNAHRPVHDTEDEPPPPTYEESLRHSRR